MFKNKLLAVVFVAGAILVSSQSFAVSRKNETKEGFYLGASGLLWPGYEKDKIDNEKLDTYLGSSARITTGYKFNMYSNFFIAPEVFASWGENDDWVIDDFFGFREKTSLFTSGVQGRFGVNIHRVYPYLTLGAAFAHLDDKEENKSRGTIEEKEFNEFGVLYGAGIELAVTNHIAMNLDFSEMNFESDTSTFEIDFIGLGISYYF